MGWEIINVEDQRLMFIQFVIGGTHSFTEACAKFGISRRIGYKWFNRFKEFGNNGLKDMSRAPLGHSKEIAPEMIEQILRIREEFEFWGPKKIKAELRLVYPEGHMPSESFIGKTLKKYSLSKPRRIRNHVAKTAPLASCLRANDVWMYDFKGWFLTENGEKCEPLTITDGFSRYLLCCKSVKSKTTDVVWNHLEKVFHEYGLPLKLRSDNGPPFASTSVGRLSPLAVKLIKTGVIPEWIEPGKPQQNGRHERFHQTLKKETAKPPATTLEEQDKRFEHFQIYFNNRRPHEALEQVPPNKIYRSSSRIWDGNFRSPEYEKGQVRRVQQTGSIKWKGTELFICKYLNGEPICITEVGNDLLEVRYGPIVLGNITHKGDFKRI